MPSVVSGGLDDMPVGEERRVERDVRRLSVLDEGDADGLPVDEAEMKEVEAELRRLVRARSPPRA